MRIPRSTALAVATIVLVGCSGGSPSAVPGRSAAHTAAGPKERSASAAAHGSGSSSAKQQLIDAADAICERLNTEFAAAKPASQTIAEIARVAPSRAALERAAVAELAKLTPPASLARTWQKIVAYRRTLADELTQLGHDADVRGVAAIRALGVSKETVHRQLLSLATAAGFKSCSRVG